LAIGRSRSRRLEAKLAEIAKVGITKFANEKRDAQLLVLMKAWQTWSRQGIHLEQKYT
jgi:hypothetical protein